MALIATSVVWALTWIGSFLGASGLFGRKGVGFWVMLVGVGLVLLGATMVWASSREAELAETSIP